MSTPMIIFHVIATGYLIGAIKVKGFNLGSSGVLIMALIFGHFGYKIPDEIQQIGLVCFVASIGLIAGADFFRSISIKSLNYIIIGFITILVGAAVCVATIVFFDVKTPLAIGIMTGALTSTPGLAAAVEATGDSIASIGYGIAYPFGVIGVVIFVQIMPRLVGAKSGSLDGAEDVDVEFSKNHEIKANLINIDKHGFFVLALAIITGILIGSIAIPLPGGVPLTLSLVGVYLTGIFLEPGWALASQCVYLALGLCGLPVYAGFASGAGVLFGLTGGFLFIFPVMAWVTSLSCRRFRGIIPPAHRPLPAPRPSRGRWWRWRACK